LLLSQQRTTYCLYICPFYLHLSFSSYGCFMLVFGFFFLVLSVRSHKYLIIAMTWRWRHSNE